MGDTGLEQSAVKPSKTTISKTSGAKSGALDDKNDSDLVRLIEAWPTLPEHVKTEINHLIEKHCTEEKSNG